MFLHAREGHVEPLGKRRDRSVRTPELLQNTAPGGVRECSERDIEVGLDPLNHMVQCTRWSDGMQWDAGAPAALSAVHLTHDQRRSGEVGEHPRPTPVAPLHGGQIVQRASPHRRRAGRPGNRAADRALHLPRPGARGRVRRGDRTAAGAGRRRSDRPGGKPGHTILAMGLLTFAINVTLDGCVDHREGIADDETHDFFTRLMDESGAMLWGRVTYEMMESYWPAVARGAEIGRASWRE